MKKQLTLLLIVLTALSACQKKGTLEQQSINSTDSTANWNINLQYTVFQSKDTETSKFCSNYNDEIKGLVEGIRAAFTERAEEEMASLDSAGIRPSAPYQLFINDTVFQKENGFISVLVQAYEWTGGANGITNFYALNYDMKNDKFLQKNDLLNADNAQTINAALKAHLQDPDNCYTFEAPTLDNCTAVCFTPTDVIFTYAKYILGPGACGPATITVPRAELKEILLLPAEK